MPRPEKHDGATLRTLERYRSLGLEEARSQRARLAESLLRDEEAHTLLETALQSAYAAQRALAQAGMPLSGDALRFAYHHGRAQIAELGEAHASRERSRALAARAQDELALRLEEYKVIERLREKRRHAGAQWDRHRAQLRLDELGVIKAWHGEGLWPSVE
jgi:hypothetical protein